MLGSNLPHTWWGKQEDGSPSEAIVIQFSNAFIEPFLQLKESQSIKELLEKASRGLRWTNEGKLIHSIEELGNQAEFDRILLLLSILKSLSQKESNQLASESYQNVLSKKFESRINKVCSHLQLHFAESISLKQVADLVYMSESNFCKFFKKATSTTFSDYLNDLRINEACHLLLSTEDNISKIAQDSGFESLSYFNRVFLRKKQLTPSRFRRV